MTIAVKEFHHFNTPPGAAHPVLASGAGSGQPVTASTSTGPAFITQILGSGANGYFADQHGNPRLLFSDTVWNMIPNAGGASAGTWQQDIDNYCDARAAQGFTAMQTCVFSTIGNSSNYGGGRTWDGVLPFTSGGDPATGLNNTFWTRVDYLIAACARNGMAAWLNLAYGDANLTGQVFAGLSTTQCQAFGTALAARYASTPNIIWQFGGDYFGVGGGSYDNLMDAVLTGLRGGGDTHDISIENTAESTSRTDIVAGDGFPAETWGTAHATFNGVYTYFRAYYGVRYALVTESSPIPVIMVDGDYYQNGGNTYIAADDRTFRQVLWWALAAGARGVNPTSQSVWQWAAGAPAAVTAEYFYNFTAGNIYTAMTSLPGWHKLLPDIGNTLVTAGGGTPAASDDGTHYGGTFTDSYVTASYAADGSLALMYLPNAATITVNTALMTAGYRAQWIDPDSGTVYAGTTGTTYNSGAVDGSKPVLNSAGDPDWVLALRYP